MRRAAFALLVCLGLLAFSSTTVAQTSRLTVDMTQELGAISPHIRGINYGPWSLISPDMMPRVPEAGLMHFRFPAGRWGDLYDLTPQHIDLFMLQVRQWNAIPSISVRLEGGTPEAAAALVRYANDEKQYDVRYWSIGNEPDLYEGYTVERYNAEWRAIALAMEEVDPTIKLVGPEVSQYPPTDPGSAYLSVRREWVRAFLEANGDLVDIVSVHRYPFPAQNGVATTAADLRADSPQWDGLIEDLRATIRETLGHDLPVALTEVNSHWNPATGGEATPDSFYHAIWWADVLARMMRQQVDIVNYFMLSSHGNLGGFGLFDRYSVRPTFHVYALYRQFGDTLIASESANPDVTIAAARRGDALTLIVVNRAQEAHRLTLEFSTPLTEREAETWRLDAEHAGERIAPTPLDGAPLELPGTSLTLYIIPNAF